MQYLLSLAPWQLALLFALVMYGATTLGASLVFFTKKSETNLLTALTSGAAGIMIAASFFSLLLPALSRPSPLSPALTVTIGFLVGGGVLVLGDFLFSRKRVRFRAMGDEKNALLFLAVTLHNIPEGMAVGVAAAAVSDRQTLLAALMLAVGIAIQNFPEGSCVAFPLRAKGVSPLRSFLFSQFSGMVEIPACVVGSVAAAAVGGLLPWALSFSAGAMIAVVCSELIPECFSKSKTVASLGILLGFCFMMFLDVAFG